MDQKVKLQISSDVEDVTKVSSCLLEEAILHINDLVNVINAAKNLLREFNLSNPNDLNKLQTSFEILNTTRIPVSKVDNRLGDVVAIVGGLIKVLTQSPETQSEQKEELQNDNVTTG